MTPLFVYNNKGAGAVSFLEEDVEGKGTGHL